ncbi:MAG: TIGR03905 family TSCPD domain-containing protein [Firmicutes bacterium]|nr:TIGR03905 family TSCPD domain-containing protein [Bacillota bacterium]
METFRTTHTCARQIIFDVQDNTLTSCKFINGCSGNAQGITKLCLGQNIDDLIEKLSGIKCKQNTSCPDQLAKALIAYKEKLTLKTQKELEKQEKTLIAEIVTKTAQ